jgi:hypothetical protein
VVELLLMLLLEMMMMGRRRIDLTYLMNKKCGEKKKS